MGIPQAVAECADEGDEQAHTNENTKITVADPNPATVKGARR